MAKVHRVEACDIDVGGLADYEEAAGAVGALLDDLPEGTRPDLFDYFWFHEAMRNIPPRDQLLLQNGVVRPVTRANHPSIPEALWRFSKGDNYQRVDAVLYYGRKGTAWGHRFAEQAPRVEAFKADLNPQGDLGSGASVVASKEVVEP